MAGLDTRGLASGFAQGFGLMNQYQQQQRQNKRQDRQDAMQEKRFGLQMETAELQKEQIQQKKDQESLKFALGKIANGMDVSDDEIELLKGQPKYWAALDPQTDVSLEQAQMVIDPESPVDANDPESLAALNQMFGAEINKGEGGKKRITGMVPGPDGESVMLELEVTGEDGETYRAPMTRGRSNAPDNDDMVMAVPVERLIEQTQGMRMLRKGFQTPEAQAQATKVLNLLRGETPERWEQIEGPGGSILQRNTRTGEMKSVMGRAPQRGGSSARQYAPSSDVKTIEYFRRQGYGHEEAVRMAMELKGRGDDAYGRGQDQVDYLQDRIGELEKTRNDRAWQGMSQEQRDGVNRDLKQLRKQRDQVADSLYGRDQPSTQGSAGASSSRSRAPAAAIDYLRKNDSPELRQQFRAKYGALPEGF